MSTYTCPHCGEHDLSTQRRHNCPKLPSLSIPLGPPRSRDPIANEYIARLSRELEEVREQIRRLREALERVVDGGCERFADTDCWQMGMDPNAKDYADRVCDPCFARRALVADTEVSDGD